MSKVKGYWVYGFTFEQLINVYLRGDLLTITTVLDLSDFMESHYLTVEDLEFEPVSENGSLISSEFAFHKGLYLSADEEALIERQLITTIETHRKHIYQNGFMFRCHQPYRDVFMRNLLQLEKGVAIEINPDFSCHPLITMAAHTWNIQLDLQAELMVNNKIRKKVKIWLFERI